ncbi:MAG: hypothetical protein KAJ19_17675, partial [Gammaproteobacteria bacterium]|nr:hypothetical protein [Gammaproteobacteria bacterium]
KVLAFEQEINSGNPHPTFNAKGQEIPLFLRDIPLKKLTVGYDDEIVEAKVYDTVVRGAEESETLWGEFAKVAQMTAEIERIPMFTPDDINFKPWVRGTKPRASGGSFWEVECNCANEKNLYGLDVGISKSFVSRRGFDAVEEVLWGVGQSAGRLILQGIVTKLLADVDSALTDTLANWGAGHYKALVKMESLIATYGMTPSVALVNPGEGYDIAILDYFIREDYSRAAKGIPASLHSVGSLFGRLPIYRSRDMTAASMILAAAEKACVVGVLEPLSIDSYDDVREGMEGAIAHLQFDVKSGKDAHGPSGATKPTAKSWAVCTSA